MHMYKNKYMDKKAFSKPRITKTVGCSWTKKQARNRESKIGIWEKLMILPSHLQATSRENTNMDVWVACAL